MAEVRPATGPVEDLGTTVRAAQNGDEAAFRTLYRTLQPGLLRYLKVIVDDYADDVASEAWLQIARDIAKFRGDWDKFRGWAATIARHRAMDHLRSVRRRPSIATPTDQLPVLVDSQDTAAAAIEALSTEAAIALIASLPRDQAEAVLLRAVLGLDAQAAGQVVGKRAGAVRTAAYRGLRRLSEELTRTPFDSPLETRAKPPMPGVTPPAAPALKKVR